MMRRRLAVAAVVAAGALVLVADASVVRAQTASPNCTATPPSSGNPADVCRKAADLFAFIVPQTGVALAGGNTILGEGGTLGGWGKRSISLRVSAVDGRVPENTVPLSLTPSSAVSNNFGAKRAPIPMASVDVAVGLFTGVPFGVTNVGGVDLLVGIVGVPSVNSGDLSISPQGSSVAFNYGVRVGLLQESSFVPGISVNYMRRKVPTLDFEYTPNNDTLRVNNVSLTSNVLRAVISKRFALIGLAAGVGRDEIEGTSGLAAIVNESGTRTALTFPTMRESVTRNTAFVNASFGISAARVVAEYGRSSKGAIRETLNTFGDRQANEAYTYASVGLTVRF